MILDGSNCGRCNRAQILFVSIGPRLVGQTIESTFSHDEHRVDEFYRRGGMIRNYYRELFF